MYPTYSSLAKQLSFYKPASTSVQDYRHQRDWAVKIPCVIGFVLDSRHTSTANKEHNFFYP